MTLSEKAIAGARGINVSINAPGQRMDSVLFNESQSRVVISCRPDRQNEVKRLATQYDLNLLHLGQVGGLEVALKVNDSELTELVENIAKLWREAITCYMNQ